MTPLGAPSPAERDARMRVGFAGAGKVGFTLGKHFALHGIALAGYYDSLPEAAEEASRFTESASFHSLSQLASASDILFITTPDDVIPSVAAKLASEDLHGRIVCHCSGSLSADALGAARDAGARCCSVHPLLAVSSKTDSYRDMASAFFTLEGDAEAVVRAAELLDACGNEHAAIPSDAKTVYHAASVFMSNFVVAVADAGTDLLASCGFTRDEARRATAVLLTRNAHAVAEKGCERALTGPIERNDAGTVERHLDALAALDDAADEGPRSGEGVAQLYARLSLQLADLASRIHPDRDYARIRRLAEDALRA